MRTLKLENARDLGIQFSPNPHRMIGQDGAYSIPLSTGAALWFFGDTLIGRRTPGESLWYPGGERLGPEDMSGRHGIELMLNNTGCLVYPANASDGIKNFEYILDDAGLVKQLIPRLAVEHRDVYRVWCLHGIELRGRVYLYYIIVRMLADGPLPVNFELIGSGLAEGSPRDWSFRRIAVDDTTLWWRFPLPQFASSVLTTPGGNYVYLYGVRKDDAGIQECCVARVAPERIAERDAYQYLSSPEPNWSQRPEECVGIMTGMPNEMSVSWNDYLGCYLAVHSLDLTGWIVARSAPDPWGPWSEPVKLWKVAAPAAAPPLPYPRLIYAGKEHPELARNHGKIIYITYIEFEEYYPHLVEVEFA